MGKFCVMTLLYPFLSVCARFLWLLKPVGMSICYASLCAKFEFDSETVSVHFFKRDEQQRGIVAGQTAKFSGKTAF